MQCLYFERLILFVGEDSDEIKGVVDKMLEKALFESSEMKTKEG